MVRTLRHIEKSDKQIGFNNKREFLIKRDVFISEVKYLMVKPKRVLDGINS